MIILYKNTKVKADFFDIPSSVLRGNTLALYLFIICQEYVFGTSIYLMK